MNKVTDRSNQNIVAAALDALGLPKPDDLIIPPPADALREVGIPTPADVLGDIGRSVKSKVGSLRRF
jgi:hypothetical protein